MRGAIIETLVTIRRLSGILLLARFALNFGGVVMYSFGIEYGWVTETPTYHTWERGLSMAGYVVAALSVALLEPVLCEGTPQFSRDWRPRRSRWPLLSCS